MRSTARPYLLAGMVGLALASACGSESGQSEQPLGQPDVDTGADVDDDALADQSGSDPRFPSAWSVVVSDDAPDPVRWAARDVVDYLGQMGLEATLGAENAAPICAPELGFVVFLGDGLGEPAFDAETTDQTWRIAETRCDGDGVVVNLSGGGLLGRQYAAYEWLHQLGVRFFHPEQEYVPTSPRWPEAPLQREHTPAFRYRSTSLHLTHPLELGDAFRLQNEDYFDEARRYIDWQVKNLASFGTTGIGTGEHRTRGRDRGFPRATGVSLYGIQQGASGLIDPDDPRPVEEQIAEAIDARIGDDPENWPDFFSFQFNPTEFTELDDRDAVSQMSFIADYIADNYPGVRVQTTNHGTAGEPTEFYGVRYFDLPQFAPPNLGVSVHPLMFYDLFRPAPVYGNENFNFLYDFMVQEYQTRPLWYFPESAWWLTFDIAIPLYLPITIEARDRDIQSIAFMLDGKLDGHRTFGSGHEWGYWQNEYCSFRMSADLDYRYTDCLADLTSPMGGAAAEVQAVLERVIALQERDIIYGDILAYLVGSDPETEVAASVGIVFHPLPPSPQSILRWDLEAVEDWQRRIAPALQRMDADYAELVDRLEAVVARVPGDGLPWFDEVLDGIEVTGLRARHAREIFGAVVTLRESQLRFDEALTAQAEALLEAAEATTEAALEVIARREVGYRYRPLSRSIAGGPDGDEDENWTIYGYRYLNRTHHGYYWTRFDELARLAFEGGDGLFVIADAVLGPEESLDVSVTDTALEAVHLDFGDGTEADGVPQTHRYDAPGLYTVALTANRDGEPVSIGGEVAALEAEYATGFTPRIVEPAGARLIEGALPGIVFGPIDAARVVLGFDVAGVGDVQLGLFEVLESANSEAIFESRPARAIVPIINRSTADIMTSIVVERMVVTLTDAESAPVLTGDLSTEAVIDAIVAIGGGFEPEGARRIVASTLGYTPETLPDFVAFEVVFELGVD